MSFLISTPLKFILPIILLGVQFSLKLFIDRRVTGFNFVTSILEVPINMFFVSLSLLAAFIIRGSGDIQNVFIIFLIILVILMFGIFIWRRSLDHFERENFWSAFGLGVLNLILSVPILIWIICFLKNNI